MKTLMVNGVPYDSTGANVFIYGSNKTVQIGTYQSEILSLSENWSSSDDMKSWLTNYRKGLKDATAAALKKAAELQLLV